MTFFSYFFRYHSTFANNNNNCNLNLRRDGRNQYKHLINKFADNKSIVKQTNKLNKIIIRSHRLYVYKLFTLLPLQGIWLLLFLLFSHYLFLSIKNLSINSIFCPAIDLFYYWYFNLCSVFVQNYFDAFKSKIFKSNA